VAAKKRGQIKGSRKARSQREAGSQSVGQKLMKALSHPLRVQILTILNDRTASPNELSRELRKGLSIVSYHVKVLYDYECIELVKTEPCRGAVEHFYKAVDGVLIPSWTLKLLPRSAQQAVFGEVLDDIEHDVGKSLEMGTFDKRPDYIVGRDPRMLDGKARKDAEELAAEFFERYRNLEAESSHRAANGESDGKLIPTTAVVLVFGSAVGKKVKPKKAKKRT
jgi:DNA-binding transcriptional ArsR family regulator